LTFDVSGPVLRQCCSIALRGTSVVAFAWDSVQVVGPAIPYRVYVGMAFGVLMGGLTLLVEKVSAISISPLIGLVQTVAMVLMLPGLFGSAIVSGNVHAYSQVVAAAINGILYFALGWISCRLWARAKRRRQRSALQH
jgi:hypothetical protein